MLKPPNGDFIGMLTLAHETGTVGSLINALNVLNRYGDNWQHVYRTSIEVYDVDVENRDINVMVHWENHGDGPNQHGGLSFETAGEDADGNTLYRWVPRQ